MIMILIIKFPSLLCLIQFKNFWIDFLFDLAHSSNLPFIFESSYPLLVIETKLYFFLFMNLEFFQLFLVLQLIY